MFCINAEGALTADRALNPLTSPDVPLIVTAREDVELKSVALADTALTEVPLILPPLRFVRAEMFVPDIVGESTSVALRSVNLALTPLIAAELTFVAALIFVAEIFTINAEGADTADKALRPLTRPDVPDMVTPREEVALKSTTLVAAEKLTAPVTVPPDRGK